MTTNIYQVHGILQALAYLIFFPLGILMAVLRDYVGPSWFELHIIFHTLGLACTLIAVAIIEIGEKKKSEESKNKQVSKYQKYHTSLGPVIITIVLLQFLWAIIGRKVVRRDIWFIGHITLSALILIGGWTNIFFAWKMHRV